MNLGGIALHALPMALESERHSIGHPQRAEHAPAIQQTHLPRAQALLMRVQDCAIVKQKAMHNSNVIAYRMSAQMMGRNCGGAERFRASVDAAHAAGYG